MRIGLINTVFILALSVPVMLKAEQTTDSIKLNYIQSFVTDKLYTQKDSTQKMLTEGIALAKKSNHRDALAYLYNQRGMCQFLNADYGEAVNSIDSALYINLNRKRFERVIENLNNKGFIYRSVGNYTFALEHFQNASKIIDTLGITHAEPTTLTNIGSIHKLLGNHFSAIDYYEKASKIALREGQGVELANAFHNLGEVYMNLKELSNAIHYFKKVVSLADEASIPFDPTNTYSKMAEVLNKQGYVDQSLYYQKKVLEITREKGYAVGTIKSLLNIGACYLVKGELNKAEQYIVEGIFEATSIERVDVIGEAYFHLATIKEKKGQLEDAMKYTKVGASLSDSLNNAEINRQLVEMQILYESERQKRDIQVMENLNRKNKAELETKTMAITFMAVIIILLILITILYSSYASIKSATNKELTAMVSERTFELEKKEKILTAQNQRLMSYAHMTSHSIRRPLSNILGIVNLYDTGATEMEAQELFGWVKTSAQELDEVIIESMEVLKEDFDPNSSTPGKIPTGFAQGA